ncbi:Atg14 domain-containing protein [Candidatus Pelagibacter sp.]|nr:Atg14 domain-containing protein [Candidatus Pelagibacter sp.]
MSSNDKDPKIFNLNEKVNLDDKLNDNNIKNNNLNNQDIKKDFINLKSSTSKINQDIRKNILELSDSIYNQEIEIKKISNEEILLNRKKIELEIFKNQKLLINEYKQINENLKKDLDNLEEKFKVSSEDNKKYLFNNEELKNTISRYIKHNKNLQDQIDQLKEKVKETNFNKTRIEDLESKVKYYQDDNSRLSNEVVNIQNKYEVIKNNLTNVEVEKNKIFRQIQDLNNSLSKNNIVGTPFVKEMLKEDSINAKVLNDISENNIKSEKKKTHLEKDLNKEINDIFK